MRATRVVPCGEPGLESACAGLILAPTIYEDRYPGRGRYAMAATRTPATSRAGRTTSAARHAAAPAATSATRKTTTTTTKAVAKKATPVKAVTTGKAAPATSTAKPAPANIVKATPAKTAKATPAKSAKAT